MIDQPLRLPCILSVTVRVERCFLRGLGRFCGTNGGIFEIASKRNENIWLAQNGYELCTQFNMNSKVQSIGIFFIKNKFPTIHDFVYDLQVYVEIENGTRSKPI